MQTTMAFLWEWSAPLLTLVAVVVACVGWPQARRFSRPGRWRIGVVLVAVGLVSLWVVPKILARWLGPATEGLGLLQFIAIGFVGGSLIGGGLNAMSRANETIEQDIWRRILD